jgi:tRNA dimethylallyltransferase
MVGGSGLYVRAAVDRLDFPGESPEIRARLYAEIAAVGPEVLHARLAQLDPVAAAAILPTNDRRVARALEVIELTGAPFTARMPGFESIYPGLVQLGLDFDDRDTLDERVALRVHRMMDRGLLDEIRALLPSGLRDSPTAGKALGYAQLLACMDDDGEVVGDLDGTDGAVELTIRGTRRFVRRQRSWFGRDPRTRWLDAASPDLLGAALATLEP